ncbi:MAG: PAS domain S-box protein [Prosthecobacter sp.]
MKVRKPRATAAPVVKTAAVPHRIVVEDLTEVVTRFLPDGTFTFVNEVFCRLFGKSEEELIGQRWSPVVVAEDLPMIEAKLAEISRENPVVVIENRIVDGEGKVRWMQFVNRGFFDDSGRLLETQSVGREITDRVEAVEKLQINQQRWRFALESSGFGMWDWDMVENTAFFSSQWKIMLGYDDPAEIPGTFEAWRDLIHPDDLKSALDELQGYIKGLRKEYTVEIRMRCKDGSWKWVRSRGQVIERDAAGTPLRMTGTHVDISKRKAAEDREARSLQLMAEGAPVEHILDAITRNVEAAHPGMTCSVMLVEPSGTRLRVKSAAGLPEEARRAIDGLPIGPETTCCGTAAYSGMRVICVDVLKDARMQPFYGIAQRFGLRACWSEPIVSSDGKVLGTLACYHSRRHEPPQAEVQAVTRAARLATLAIEREWKAEALRISEQRYARALRGTTDGLWDWNIVTGDTFLSPRWKEMLGFAEDEFPDSREEVFLSLLHPDDVALVKAARREHFDRRGPYRVEARLRTRSGDYRWFLIRGQADWNDIDEPVRMTGTISDITERKLAEQARAESEARFRAVFEQAAVGIAVIESATGRYLSVNSRMCEINRRSVDEMLKLTFMDVTHPDDLQEDLDQMEDLKAGRISSFKMEKRNVAPDGEITWINLTVAPMWRPGEPPLRHIAVVEDITQRKQAEFNYQRELAYNRALVDHTGSFIVVLDVDGRFVHANSTFYTAMGYTADDVKGRTPWELGLMSGEEALRSRERFARLLKGEDNPPTDTRLRTKDGKWRVVELRSTSTRRADGQADRIIITGTDMTERNRLQQEIMRVVEQEHARIGHDLHDGVGQTMTGIVTMMEALENELEGETKVFAERIHELLAQSVSEVRRMSHGLSPTSIKYRGLSGALQLLAETVRTNFRTPCECEADAMIEIRDKDKEAHLFRIAQEAVTNALRHGKPSRVAISLRQGVGGTCELKVEDDGVGIKRKKDSVPGGIGVRVMEYRANLIGGRLKVSSSGKKGCVVSCQFETSPPEQEPVKKKRASGGAKKTSRRSGGGNK